MISTLLDKWSTSRVIGPVAITVALLVLMASEIGHRELRLLNTEREASVQAQMTVGRLRRALLFMESATRGYMVTGRDEYLAPYHAQTGILNDTLVAAEKLSRDEFQDRVSLERLVEVSRRKKSELQETLRLFQEGKPDLAIDLLHSDIGKEMMIEISDLTDEVIRFESGNFSTSGNLRTQVSIFSRSAIWILVIGCLLGSVALMRLGRARDRERQIHMVQLHAERDRLDEEVTRRTAEIEALAQHMERVREDEKARLARELHDELGGLLTAAKLDVARIRKRLPEAGQGLELLAHLNQSLDAGIALKRRIIEDLRPSSLSNLGLQATLLNQCSEFASRADLEVVPDIEAVTVNDETALAIYRIVQEAFTNIAKYAKATRVRVSLKLQRDALTVQVTDNGVGFEEVHASGTGGHGLQGMRFRVKACAGDLHIRSGPGRGALIAASFPLSCLKPARSPD